MCTFFFFISIDHHDDLQMPPDRAISFVNSPPPLLVSNINNRTVPFASGTIKLAGNKSEIVQIAFQTAKI
jgi:hypothetical protein